MSVLMVPTMEGKPWPTLGPQVIAWIEANLVFGPGPLRGQPAVVDPETQGLICRMYEFYPICPKASWRKGATHEGHWTCRTHRECPTGRRRFTRAALSQRKGTAKTEKLAWIAIAELHPDAPVRVVGWNGRQPIAGGVADPYIPLVAYTEEQSEELAFGTMLAILQDENCPVGQDFDLGLERIMRRTGDGKAVALAGAPNARDGARTTFQGFDETHRMTLARLKKAHQTMLANTPKRFDSWTLETTTAFTPGENSVAEDTMGYAQKVAAGTLPDSKLFFFHRQASDHHDLTTVKGRTAAVREASGPAVKWSNVKAIVDQYADPTVDKAYWERVWLNRVVKSADQAFDVKAFVACLRKGYSIPDGALVALSFDGARRRDSTCLMATEITTGFQEILNLWEKPEGPAGKDWEVPAAEVTDAVAAAFERFDVWKLYADPAYWESHVDDWSGLYGEGHVVKRWTGGGFELKTAYAVRAYTHAILAREVGHNGDPRFQRHVGNARKKPLSRLDDEQKPLWSIQKERPDSPLKIDVSMTAVLGWEARGHAVAEGAVPTASEYERLAAEGRRMREEGTEGPVRDLIDAW